MAQILLILKKSWHWILLIILALVVFLKYFRSKSKNPDLDAENILKKNGITQEDQVAYLKTTAARIASDLGTAYSIFDPRSWWENDKNVFHLINQLSSSERKIVGDVYSKVYAKGRSLTADLAKYLDSEYYNRLSL